MLTAVVCAGFIGVRVRGGRGSDCGSACGSVSDMVDESSDEVDESNSWLIACSTYVWRRCCCIGVVVVLIVVGGVGMVVVVVGVSCVGREVDDLRPMDEQRRPTQRW